MREFYPRTGRCQAGEGCSGVEDGQNITAAKSSRMDAIGVCDWKHPAPVVFASLTAPTPPTRREVGPFPFSDKGFFTSHAPPPRSWGRSIRAEGEERVGGANPSLSGSCRGSGQCFSRLDQPLGRAMRLVTAAACPLHHLVRPTFRLPIPSHRHPTRLPLQPRREVGRTRLPRPRPVRRCRQHIHPFPHPVQLVHHVVGRSLQRFRHRCRQRRGHRRRVHGHRARFGRRHRRCPESLQRPLHHP